MSEETKIVRCNGEKNDGNRCTREKEFPVDDVPENWKCWQHQEDTEVDVGGRRPKFETAEEMQKLIDDYFDSCFVEAQTDDGKTYQKQIRPFTVTGLAYHLGMTRQGLLDYQAKNKKFNDTITHAKTRIEMYAEEQLFRNQGKTNGVQFNLKNNFNWKDKQEIDHGLKDVSSVEIELVDDEG
mgnify:CR=1 FL=1